MKNDVKEIMKLWFLWKWEIRLEKIFLRFPLEVREEYIGGFLHFLENEDHGLPHAADVCVKALEIAGRFPKEERIDLEIVEVMSVFHDAGRFLVPRDTAANYEKRKRKGQTLHEYAGVLLENIFGYSHPIIREGILRHDYFSEDFDPGKKPPVSLEAQILRAADKTSIDPVHEITRYDEYRRKFNFPLFKRETPIEFRLDWNFSMKRDQRTDQICYFLAVLALRPEDFIHPVLQQYYREWSKQKKAAVEKIIEIVDKEEGPGAADIVECVIITYLKSRQISL